MTGRSPAGSGCQPAASASISVESSRSGIPSAFTPGPWRFDLDDENVVAGLYGEELIVDAPLGGAPAQAIANGHLIAAAPELYRALGDMLEHADVAGFIYERAKAALAKARGETA